MLYTNYLSNLQAPYNFLVIMGGIIFIIALLFLNKAIDNIKLHRKIIAGIKEKKAKDPNCCVVYKGKIY